MVEQGGYSYTGPDGIVYRVTYIADEMVLNHGAHLRKIELPKVSIPRPTQIRNRDKLDRFNKSV